MSQNPLFNEFNDAIDFASVTKKNIHDATKDIISHTKKALKNIYGLKKEERTFDNTMVMLDNINNDISNIAYPVYLLGETHPDDDIRKESKSNIAAIMKFENEIMLDEKLYKAVKEYSQTDEAKKLRGYKKKFLTETVRDFERNGFALPKEKRKELKKIQDKLSELSIEFSKNIAESDDPIFVKEKEMEGLPEDYKAPRKQENGTYKIDLSYPSYRPFMKYSPSESARKELFMKFNNRAADTNLKVLKELLINRIKMAHLLGYKTFAEYKVETKMVKKTKTVWDFKNSLAKKVKLKSDNDFKELLDIKRKQGKNKNAKVVQSWESLFCNNILLKEKYHLDQEKVKEYFELNNVLNGLFTISQTLFDIEFKEVKNPSVWHEDVRLFEVFQDDKLISRFYLDLFPRDSKYSHAACFPMIRGKATKKGYQIPAISLVCNFPRPTKKFPSLLPHLQVVTIFHEFGHLLHNVLTKSKLCSYSGTSVLRDFVETPSQLFENWTWNYDALKLFAKHYKTGEVLPRKLFDRMRAAKNVGSGLGAMTQIYYSAIDFTFHDGYDPEGKESTTDVIKKLSKKYVPFPFTEGTHFQASFGHLAGYEAGYYSYMWAKVYAEDVFSVFEKNGIMDKETGVRFRDIILAKGGNEDPLKIVKKFLGRAPNQDAFLKSIGLHV